MHPAVWLIGGWLALRAFGGRAAARPRGPVRVEQLPQASRSTIADARMVGWTLDAEQLARVEGVVPFEGVRQIVAMPELDPPLQRSAGVITAGAPTGISYDVYISDALLPPPPAMQGAAGLGWVNDEQVYN